MIKEADETRPAEPRPRKQRRPRARACRTWSTITRRTGTTTTTATAATGIGRGITPTTPTVTTTTTATAAVAAAGVCSTSTCSRRVAVNGRQQEYPAASFQSSLVLGGTASQEFVDGGVGAVRKFREHIEGPSRRLDVARVQPCGSLRRQLRRHRRIGRHGPFVRAARAGPVCPPPERAG